MSGRRWGVGGSVASQCSSMLFWDMLSVFLKAKAAFKAGWPLAFPVPKALSSLSRDNVTDLQTQATGFKAVYSLALVGLPWLAPVSHRVPCCDQGHILKMWLASQAVVMEEWRNDPNGSNPLTFSLALTNCPNK